jgi:(p)ppGpp synthase/HD superfamily hydrolase
VDSIEAQLLDKALIFAARAHEGQYRKGTTIPYITHPVALAMALLQMECPGEVVAAALLHDVVEDTAVTLAEIEQAFGPEIADLVASVSEPDRRASWEARKAHTIAAMRDAPFYTKLIVCTDKLHNLRSVVRDYAEEGEGVWDRFNRGKAKQAWYYHQLVESLMVNVTETDRYPVFGQLAAEVDHLFGKRDEGLYNND